jgi:hypothetical protein
MFSLKAHCFLSLTSNKKRSAFDIFLQYHIAPRYRKVRHCCLTFLIKNLEPNSYL